MESAAALHRTDLKDVFAANRAAGKIVLSAAARGGVTRRGTVYEHGPLRVRFPNVYDGTLEAVFVNTAGGVAAWSVLPPGESVSTVDLRVDFLEPADLTGPLRAEAVLVRKGNRVCHVRIQLTQGERLVAEGTGVFNIHRKREVP